jgi:hypothetical protein
MIRQRHSGDRKLKDLARHSRDTVEAFAGRGIEEIEAHKRVKTLFFVVHDVASALDVCAIL